MENCFKDDIFQMRRRQKWKNHWRGWLFIKNFCCNQYWKLCYITCFCFSFNISVFNNTFENIEKTRSFKTFHDLLKLESFKQLFHCSIFQQLWVLSAICVPCIQNFSLGRLQLCENHNIQTLKGLTCLWWEVNGRLRGR